MPKLSLDLGQTELDTLLVMLTEVHDQQMAMMTLLHSTEAEREECKRRALICSIVKDQLTQ